MSGTGIRHLQRRDGIFHLRMRVPDDVRQMIGQREIRRSLGSCGIRTARRLVAIYAARILEAFEMVRILGNDQENVAKVMQHCLGDIVAQTEDYDRFRPRTNMPDQEIEWQEDMSRERIADLQCQIVMGTFDGRVIRTAERYVEGTAVEAASPAILEGVAHALIEEQRLAMLRLRDRISPFVPEHPLLRPQDRSSAVSYGPVAKGCPAAAHGGVTVGEAIASYIAAKGKLWRPKTLAARKWQLGYMQSSLGSDTILAAITKHDIRRFRDQITSLRKNHGPSKTVHFLKKLTSNEAHQIAPKSAELIFEPCKAMLRWAWSEEGLIDTNPAEGVRLVTQPSKAPVKSRRPFSEEELVKLFSSPLFIGHKSRDRRYDPGTKLIKDAKWWIPVLGFYTGARLGELAQLHTRDIYLDGPIPYISINEDNSGLSAGALQKHLKSPAAARNVPIHLDVMELGFAEFVARRTQSPKAPIRLFPEVDYGSDGQASTVFSKFFGRLMAKVNLTDPALVFHSFRHSAEDAFRNAGQHQYVIDRIIGHANGATSAGYGEGIDLETAYGAVVAMKLKGRLPALMNKKPVP